MYNADGNESRNPPTGITPPCRAAVKQDPRNCVFGTESARADVPRVDLGTPDAFKIDPRRAIRLPHGFGIRRLELTHHTEPVGRQIAPQPSRAPRIQTRIQPLRD